MAREFKEIVLSQEELNEIKDTIKFRTKVTLDLKCLQMKMDSVNGVKNSINWLKANVGIHWLLILTIISALLYRLSK